MKKTLITLLALTGVAMGDTLTLDSKTVSFGGNSTLTTGNQAMSWNGTEQYDNWYMEFSFTNVTSTSWKSTITTGINTGSPSGICVGTKSTTNEGITGYTLTFTNGSSQLTDAPTLAFELSDTLTFAMNDRVAYIGNLTSKEYISITMPDSMVRSYIISGSSRAWSNSGNTKIGTTTIASLDNLTIPEGEALDMATLVTTGEAVTKAIPEPATATLSLLALAGLAMRRRRR